MTATGYAPEVKVEPAEGPSPPAPRDLRLRYLGAGLLVLGLLIISAWLQPYRIDTLSSPKVMSFDWLTHPIEVNAHLRLRQVEGDFNALAMASDGRQAFAVGNGGLILETFDGGYSWKQKTPKLSDADLAVLSARLAPPAPVAPTPETRLRREEIRLEPGLAEKLTAEIANRYGDRILFAPDSSGLTPTARKIVQDWAVWMTKNPDKMVTLAGHTDSTGSREYNLALGQRMVDQVMTWLDSLGVDTRRVRTISYGEERQAFKGTDEKTMALNRRVVINVSGEFRETRDAVQQRAAAPAPPSPILTSVEALEQIDFQAVSILPDDPLSSLSGNRVLIGGNNGTILMSDDAGMSWKLGTGDGLTNSVITGFSLLSAENTVLAPKSSNSENKPTDHILASVRGTNSSYIHSVKGSIWRTDTIDGAVDLRELNKILVSPSGRKYDEEGGPFGVGSDWHMLEAATDSFRIMLKRQNRLIHTDESLNDFVVNHNFTSALAVGNSGQIMSILYTDGQTRFSGTSSQEIRITKANLLGVAGNPDGAIWAAGTAGTVIQSQDGGKKWTVHAVPFIDELRDIAFANDNRTGLAVGNSGTIIRSSDGGDNWSIVAADNSVAQKAGVDLGTRAIHEGYPAPWFFIGLILPAFFFLQATRRPPSPPPPEPSISEIYASDQPITSPEKDGLNFGDLAKGLAAFLLNPQTEPPLTMAVSGKWGTGKSSLMGLICRHLRENGYSTVWFNAWHHQKENHLLAALLEVMRSEAISPWWKPVGIRFRARLFWIRFQRQPWTIGFLIFLTVIPATFSFSVPVDTYGKLAEGVVKLIEPQVIVKSPERPKEVIKEEVSESETQSGDTKTLIRQTERTRDLQDANGSMLGSSETDALFKGVGALLSLIGALFVVMTNARSRLGAFGLDPSRLLKPFRGKLRSSELRALVSFRHNFAREFADATEALAPRRIVLVIDDLDRCQPEHVVEILEAVNFLVSSGKLYIILGMDMAWVEMCIAQAYKEIAEAVSFDESEPSSGQDRSTDPAPSYANLASGPATLNDDTRSDKTEIFARKYLQKLVNIDVPVPEPDIDQGTMLTSDQPLNSEKIDKIKKEMAEQKRRKRQRHWLFVACWICFGVAVSMGTSWLVSGWYGWKDQVVSDALTTKETSKDLQDKKKLVGEVVPKSQTNVNPPVSSGGATSVSKPGQLLPGNKLAQYELWISGMSFILLGIFLFLARRHRDSLDDDLTSGDTHEFNAAMNVWGAYVLARDLTPRSVKRFVNRVRYLAMRRRFDENSASVSEENLIAAAAIHHCRGEVPDPQDWPSDPAGQLEFIFGQKHASNLGEKVTADLIKDIIKNSEKIRSWLPGADQIRLFNQWVQKITVR